MCVYKPQKVLVVVYPIPQTSQQKSVYYYCRPPQKATLKPYYNMSNLLPQKTIHLPDQILKLLPHTSYINYTINHEQHQERKYILPFQTTQKLLLLISKHPPKRLSKNSLQYSLYTDLHLGNPSQFVRLRLTHHHHKPPSARLIIQNKHLYPHRHYTIIRFHSSNPQSLTPYLQKIINHYPVFNLHQRYVFSNRKTHHQELQIRYNRQIPHSLLSSQITLPLKLWLQQKNIPPLHPLLQNTLPQGRLEIETPIL